MKIHKQLCLFLTIVSLACVTLPAKLSAQSVTYNERYTIQGFSQPSRFSELAAPIPGILKSRNVKEGDVVRAGDCVVQLDRSIHDARIQTARIAKDATGELEIAKAELAAKQSRLDRLFGLAQRNHATVVEVQQAQEDIAVATAGVKRAEDRLAQQKAEFDRLVAEAEQYCVKAPFDGVVVEFVKNVGEYVGPSEPQICTLADLDELSVEFLVPRAYRGDLKVGNAVEVVFTMANQVSTGVVSYISPFPNGETNTYKIKVRVSNVDGTLSAGERCLLRSEGDLSYRASASSEDQDNQRGQ